MKSKFYAVALACSVVAVSCKQQTVAQIKEIPSENKPAPSASAGFDVNDVSYLFPRKNGVPFPEIKVSEGEILKESTFKTITEFGLSKAVDPATGKKVEHKISLDAAESDRSNWRVSAFRYDPCFPAVKFAKKLRGDQAKEDEKAAKDPIYKALSANIPDCIVQFRLIVQPFVNGADRDVTMHLVYSFPPGTPTLNSQDDMLKGLVELRDEARKIAPTAGVALGIHPALASTSPDAVKFSEKVSAFVLKHARSTERLRGVAMMGLENPPEPWVFFAGKVLNDVWTADPMPSFAGVQNFSIKFDARIPGVIPNGTDLNVTKLSTAPAFNKATVTEDQKQGLHKIEHPDDIHFFNMDCVSCHTSTTRITILNVVPKERFLPHSGVTAFPQRDTIQALQKGNWSLRNFGYFNGKPSVSMRTITETAEVVTFTNDITGENNPGLQCTPEKAMEVYKCSALPGGAADCLALCK